MTKPNLNDVVFGMDGKPMYEIVAAIKDQAVIGRPVFGGKPLVRVGFLSPIPPRYAENTEYIHDSRPIAWPLFHPYWVVRMSADANMLMAYVERLEDVKVYWPEATEITVFEDNATHYGFNANFPEPKWLAEVQAPGFTAQKRLGVYRILNEEAGLSLIGASDDVDYQVQLHVHQLTYGVHENADFQKEFTTGEDLTYEFRETATLEAAEKLAKELQAFDQSEGDLPTTLRF